jgi:hypothetical protein
MSKLVYIKLKLRNEDLNEYRKFWHFFLRWTLLLLRVHACCKAEGTERYNMNLMSLIMVPSQYRDANNVPIYNSDMQF